MDSFGKYQIEKQIGVGGTASVYLATHTGLARKVVLKVMSQELFMQDIDYKKLFIEEAQTIARLHHPNIIQVYDVNTESERIYIEMEYLSGGTLKDRIQENLPFDPITIISEMAAALQYVFNANGTIHRDIKPSNILFREEENKLSAVLTDFGISKTHNNDSEFTNIGVRVGTPRYMSPEQLMGGYIDQRSDLYSLGIIFYELLSGQLFNKDQTPGVIENFKTPQLPSEHKRLQPIINKLVTPNPNDRFNTAGELKNALARFDSPSSSFTKEKKVKGKTSNKNIVIASTVVCLLAIAGGGFAIYKKQKNDELKKAELESIETAMLKLKQDEVEAALVFNMIDKSLSNHPKEPKLKQFTEKTQELAKRQQLRSIISNATQSIKSNDFDFAEKKLTEAMQMSPTEIEEDEINEMLSLINEERIKENKRIADNNRQQARQSEITNLGTMIISGFGYTNQAPIISKIKELRQIDSWPRVRVSNNKPLFIQCLYKSPNDEIFRLHPYPNPKSSYSSSPQQPGTVIDIPLGEESPGTSIITCIGSKKNLENEFMTLFDSQYKLDRLTNIKDVVDYLKQETANIALIETTEVEFK